MRTRKYLASFLIWFFLVRDITTGEIDQGAVCDLAENSAALAALVGTNQRSHALMADGGPAGTAAVPARFLDRNFANFEGALTKTRCTRRNIIGVCTSEEFIFPQDIVDSFRFREANDAIVPVSSQQGGLTGGTTLFPGKLHFGAVWFDGLTDDRPAGARTDAVLVAASSSDLLANGFPAPGSTGRGGSESVPGQGTVGDEAACSSQCGSNGPLVQVAATGQIPVAQTLEATPMDDPGARIVSPTDGEIFAPGDIVYVTIEINEPALVGGAFLASILGTPSVIDPPYEMSLTIPEEASGRFSLTPYSYDGVGDRHDGPSIDIVVQPTTTPEELYVSDYFKLVLPEPTGTSRKTISVVGMYPNEVELNLGDSALGTTYTSSNESVVEVDEEGVLTPVAEGHAVVSTQAMGLEGHTVVKVEQEQVGIPLLGEDVTHQLEIQKGGIRLNRRTGFYVQQITVRNRQAIPVPGPLALVLANLPNGVSVVNRNRTTDNVAPGSPMFDIPLSGRGYALFPGEEASFTIEFLNPTRQRLSYTTQVFLAENP